MEILELVDGKPGGNESSDLRMLQPTNSLTEMLANAQGRQAPNYQRGINNLIRGLVDLLPKYDANWPLDDRAKWLLLAAGIFEIGYKAGDNEHKKINIAVKAESANS